MSHHLGDKFPYDLIEIGILDDSGVHRLRTIPDQELPYESIDGLIVGQCGCNYKCPIVLGELECMYCGRAFTPDPEVLARLPITMVDDDYGMVLRFWESIP